MRNPARPGLAPDLARRRVLVAGIASGTAALVAGCAPRMRGAAGDGRTADADEGEDVLPVEDLMREHGVLRRVLLVYEEVLRRFEAREPLPPDALPAAAEVIRRFVEDYHERQEEESVFPRFVQAGTLLDLVAVLQRQHAAGRRLTEAIGRLAPAAAEPAAAPRARVAPALREFLRMYRPHAAREDTVLFPAFRRVIGAHAYEVLGEKFEDREHARFGADGFERIVAEVAEIERTLGIADLDAFTPA